MPRCRALVPSVSLATSPHATWQGRAHSRSLPGVVALLGGCLAEVPYVEAGDVSVLAVRPVGPECSRERRSGQPGSVRAAMQWNGWTRGRRTLSGTWRGLPIASRGIAAIGVYGPRCVANGVGADLDVLRSRFGCSSRRLPHPSRRADFCRAVRAPKFVPAANSPLQESDSGSLRTCSASG